MPRVRSFDHTALFPYASPRLRPSWNPGTFLTGKVWQFLILLPRWIVREDQSKDMICTAYDENWLRRLLEQDFGGLTVGPTFVRGIGRRDEVYETNVHRAITVLASRWRGTWRYFKALRKELEACSGEQQILILHQSLNIV